MIKIGICDDVSVIREELRVICIDWAMENDQAVDVVCCKSTGELIHNCDSSKEAFDIIFMDIAFGEDFNGVDAVKEINLLCPYCKIIYVSAYSDYVSEVYETEHTYFVLKNKNMRSNVHKALDKAFESLKCDKQEIVNIRSNGGVCRVAVMDIICFERDGRATVVITAEGPVRTYETFEELLEKINSKKIKRCHKSYVVNFFHVSKYTKAKFTMDNEQIVPISRAYQKQVFECFTDYIDESVVNPIFE